MPSPNVYGGNQQIGCNAYNNLGNYMTPYPQYYVPQMGSQMQMQVNNVGVLRGRPVANVEEANAAMIDLDGSLFIFPNEANKRIYTKRIGLDGNPEFLTYVLEEKKPNDVKDSVLIDRDEYVSRHEFDKVLRQINKRFDDMEVDRYESDADV